ncbi:MAG: hypothetical protein A2Y70_02045 [Candidatus Aminicenantes bacterium RBG_13_64_14]|nr:MAG: hypothetical protein A2Y70_02045 [Candidatus Aminicenantes bacterium RBG_13_64_14]
MNGNGRVWKSLQTVALIVTLAFILVDKLVMPNVNSGKLADAVASQDRKIAVLEECVLSLRPLPAEVYGIKASMDGVRSAVDRMERKIDSHIERGK